MPLLRLLLCLSCLSLAWAASPAFGTYGRLFSANSLWNCRPVNPVFENNVTVPLSDYYPTVAQGTYSTGVFLATASDPPVTIYPKTQKGVWNVDALDYLSNLTLPHWPASAKPATGSDGHCEVVDQTTGILHSFWQLSKDNTTGRWVVQQYAWAHVDGLGFGDPAHYYQGARAAGVPTSGGLIRISEVHDGNPTYLHALAMSMPAIGLSPDPAYVYPATSADTGAADDNKGKVPEGGLVMLPADYNTTITGTASALLKKVADTLKVYGAYVVDRNTGTPYEIYVENGADFSLMPNGWDNNVASELQRIRAALRLVKSADKYLDGNGATLEPYTNVNLLSMRGPGGSWGRTQGDATVRFDTWTQSLVYDQPNSATTIHSNGNGLGIGVVNWGKPQVGKNYTFGVIATGNPKFQMQVYSGSAVNFTSGYLANGQSVSFVFPTGGWFVFSAMKPAGAAGSVRGTIILTTPPAAPTPVPTKAPTKAPTSTSAATSAPTSAPTSTSAATSAPTSAPTSASTSAPTSASTPAPTSTPLNGTSTTASDVGVAAFFVPSLFVVVLCTSMWLL
eukprot:Phypoly_transcript_06259.p1 GENE.Phypoly_transcript_06259~~Phypoly_transcript_06259.p1  ORF type:complete len:564 (+),score=93.68 Phypoly_transcript_06259:89-1780(+)